MPDGIHWDGEGPGPLRVQKGLGKQGPAGLGSEGKWELPQVLLSSLPLVRQG